MSLVGHEAFPCPLVWFHKNEIMKEGLFPLSGITYNYLLLTDLIKIQEALTHIQNHCDKIYWIESFDAN